MFRVATSTATPKIITPLISAFVKHIEIGVGLAEIHLEMFKGKPERLVLVLENQAEREGPGLMNVPIARSHGSMRQWLRAIGTFVKPGPSCSA